MVSHTGYSILYYHKQLTVVPVSPYPHQHLLFSLLFFILFCFLLFAVTILTGMK